MKNEGWKIGKIAFPLPCLRVVKHLFAEFLFEKYYIYFL